MNPLRVCVKTAVFPAAPPWATRHDSLIPPSLSSTLRKWNPHFLLLSDLAPAQGRMRQGRGAGGFLQEGTCKNLLGL